MTNKDIIVSLQTIIQDISRLDVRVEKRKSILIRLLEIQDYHEQIIEQQNFDDITV